MAESQVVRSICIAVTAFLCVAGQTIMNWWRRSVNNKRNEYIFLYDGLVKQVMVVGVIFMFMSFVEHFGFFEEAQVDIFGPAQAPLSRVRGQFRIRFLVRCDRQVAIGKVVDDWLSRAVVPSGVRVVCDIDPYSFL